MKECCPTDVLPIISNYKGVGKMQKLQVGDQEVEMYVVGSGSKSIIHITDIFGFHPNAFQAADIIANKG